MITSSKRTNRNNIKPKIVLVGFYDSSAGQEIKMAVYVKGLLLYLTKVTTKQEISLVFVAVVVSR